jgi:hypothetical protein
MMFCIGYALVGIPLLLVFMANIGDQVTRIPNVVGECFRSNFAAEQKFVNQKFKTVS